MNYRTLLVYNQFGVKLCTHSSYLDSGPLMSEPLKNSKIGLKRSKTDKHLMLTRPDHTFQGAVSVS